MASLHFAGQLKNAPTRFKNVLKVRCRKSRLASLKLTRRTAVIGLSIKAASYSQEQLKASSKLLLTLLKPGEDLVALQHAF